MGLFDKLFDVRIPCPSCGTAGAKVTLGGVKCVNPACGSYDAALAGQAPSAAPGARAAATPIPATPIVQPAAARPSKMRVPITIEYQNHRCERKTFTGDARSVRDRGAFVSVRVEPKGRRIALRKDGLLNRAAVEAALRRSPSDPTKHEAYVLRYHSERGSTSPLYERLRVKYPGW